MFSHCDPYGWMSVSQREKFAISNVGTATSYLLEDEASHDADKRLVEWLPQLRKLENNENVAGRLGKELTETLQRHLQGQLRHQKDCGTVTPPLVNV
ncbi:unnamed protein product, partial [Amoebophrya sp. A25]|eukprot:GSA25T00022152001.1